MRVENILKQVQKLNDWCVEGTAKIDMKITSITGQQGRTEEEYFLERSEESRQGQQRNRRSI